MNPIYKFELNRTTVNLLNPKTVVSGLLNTNNGSVSTSSIYQTSDFIPVTPGTNYKLCDAETFTAWAAAAACFYTANKTFISGQYGIGETPANAAYLRVSYQGLSNGYGVFPSTVSTYSDYVTPQAFPIYKDDLAKDFEKESNQEFFRAKLSGNLSFVGPDYDWIVGRAFDFQYIVTIFISYNAGRTWTEYWRGTFWKTDCDFDDNAKTVSVKPTVWDQYNDVLAGMDKEYNLIELAPEIVPVKADKRPMVQVYVPGQSVIGCFLSGMWWEQECESVRIDETITIGEQEINKLTDYLHFALNKTIRIAEPSGNYSPETGMFTFVDSSGVRIGEFFEATSGNYTLIYEDMGGNATKFSIKRNSDNVVLWELNTGHYGMPPYRVTLAPVTGTDATGNIVLYVHELPVFSRFVLDAPQISGSDTYPIPSDDIVENNRNYTRIIGYYSPDTIYFSTLLTSTPNKWGLYQPGQYYQQPYLYWNPELFPVARNAWGRVSIWFTFSAFNWIIEESGRQPFTIRHAYPLSSVISVLLDKIAPGITHEATTDYSQFLYGTNLVGITQTLLITPKSNIVTGGYDQPAQKAPITLKNVTDMLRDCFRCYWFVDEQNRFRIEHIQYFRNGGSYSGSPVVGIDLTAQKVSRNGKEWAFGRDQYKFDKPGMAARYQFGWMDDVTQLFDGYPIDIISKYVNPNNIEQINVSRFTSDIDYILLNPGEISKDGFVLMAGIANNLLSETKTIVTTQSGSTGYGLIMPFTRDQGAKIRIRIKVDSGDAVVRFNTAGGAGISSGPRFYSTDGIVTQTLNVPDNVGRLTVITSVIGATVTVYEVSSGYALPYYNYVVDNQDHYLQNAYVAFCILQRYYAFDMPARHYSINGVQMNAQGIKKLKNQTLRFPTLNDPDLVQLVKTNLGNGMIEKLSVNLSSRNANASLKYDTE